MKHYEWIIYTETGQDNTIIVLIYSVIVSVIPSLLKFTEEISSWKYNEKENLVWES